MSSKNIQISSENHEMRGGISRYVDEQFVICSRNLDVLADKQDIGSFICGEILNRL